MEVTIPKCDIFTCDICVDDKSVTSDMFKILGCNHSYCKNCIIKYISSKLQENISLISCPVTSCNRVLEPQSCGSILPNDVFVRWGDVLCESMIMRYEKFYCPFKDCSAVFIDECADIAGDMFVVVVAKSKCPECRRFFCAKCRVPWHLGIVCEEFEKLNKDEREIEGLQLLQLVKSQEWQRCPSCRMYVGRSDGCAQMRCRCGCDFCYRCGAHSSDHYCKNCERGGGVVEEEERRLRGGGVEEEVEEEEEVVELEVEEEQGGDEEEEEEEEEEEDDDDEEMDEDEEVEVEVEEEQDEEEEEEEEEEDEEMELEVEEEQEDEEMEVEEKHHEEEEEDEEDEKMELEVEVEVGEEQGGDEEELEDEVEEENVGEDEEDEVGEDEEEYEEEEEEEEDEEDEEEY